MVTVDSPTSRLSYSTTRMYRNGRATSERLGNFEGPLSTLYSLHVYDRSLSWDEGIKWLVEFTTLPVIAKGILRAEDALKAIGVGVQGIVVSNHGGRSVDTAPATVSSLGGRENEDRLELRFFPFADRSPAGDRGGS